MSFFSANTMKKGFSLIELLVVIIIISIVYYLGFSGMEKSGEKVKVLNPKTLKSSVLHSELYQGEATFLCINKCQNCYLRKNVESPFEAFEGKISLQHTQAYVLDADESLLRKEYGRYQDQKICLVLHFYPNGSSSQLILKQKDHVYFLPAYFGEAREFDTLEDAKEFWLQKSTVLENGGEFY